MVLRHIRLAQLGLIEVLINIQSLLALIKNYIIMSLDKMMEAQIPPLRYLQILSQVRLDIGDGDKFTFIRRLIPDVTFRDSTNETPRANLVVKTRNFPGVTFSETSSDTISQSASSPIEFHCDHSLLHASHP